MPTWLRKEHWQPYEWTVALWWKSRVFWVLRFITTDIRRARHNGVEIQRVFDDATQNYMVLYLGWEKDRRVQKAAIHVRIKEDKIWIEADETDQGFANALIRAGVPRHDIVLAFHAPEMRRHSEFAPN